MKLTELKKNETGKVISIDDNDQPLRQRLLDLGFVPGTAVFVKRIAPLGCPIEYELRGTTICLRKSEAKLISVKELDKPMEQH